MSYLRNTIKVFIFILLFLPCSLYAQEKKVREIHHAADETAYSKAFGEDITRLIGHVRMWHDDVFLTCDSAHFNQKSKKFLGFSNVHIIKADTLQLWGDKLRYDGINMMTQLDGRVRMEQNESILKTSHLNYNMNEEIAWYYGGGQIIDGNNQVESGWGYYYVKKEDYYFKESVFMSNEDNTLSTDTLFYNSDTEFVKFLGPTQIFGDTNYIYCENGWYDSQNNLSGFYKNAYFQSREQVMEGDSLIYDRENEISWAYGNVKARDTIQNSLIFGEKLYFDEQKDHIEVTKDAMYIMVDGLDSLFLHADTLLSYQIDSVQTRKIVAFHKVQFFRDDIQGRCDSLDYVVADSIIQLFSEPILWQEKNQLTAVMIKIKLGDNGIKHIEMDNKGFLITQIDSLNYNQVKGKSVIGYFKGNTLTRVMVTGNGESVFYPEDNNGQIGLNKVLSSQIQMVFKDGKVHLVKFITDPESELTPMSQIKEEDKFLDGFIWHTGLRPKSKADLYEWK